MSLTTPGCFPEVADSVTCNGYGDCVSLLREPDAANPHVRFDERDVETEAWWGFQGTVSANQLCGLGLKRNELVAELFSLPLEFHLESLLPVGVSGGPDGFVIFDLIFDHSVKDHGDFVRSRSGGGPGAELSFQSAQIVAQGSEAVMEGKGCQAEDVAGAIFHRSYSVPQ